MKPAVVFVLTFVLAGAASTGAKVALTKPAPAVVDSAKVHADSTKTDTAIVASGQASVPPTDTAARPVAAAAHADSTRSGAAATAGAAAPTPGVPPLAGRGAAGAPVAGTAPAAAVKAPADTVMQASERRLAKVFTSMDAKQAAKVLEHMADSDIQVILGYVGPRQAASIMEALPPERVATLSKLALGKK